MQDQDADARKESVRRIWGERGQYWDRHADALAEMADTLNRPMLEAAGIQPGQHVLDLASGAGEPALTIARLVAPEGTVCASDLSGEMLAGAERRAKAAGLANMGFEIVDMEAMPFDDARFDRVTCRFGLMFSPRPERALAEVRRVLVAGGRAAFMVWGPRAECTMFDVLAGAAADVFGAEDEKIDYETPFAFAESGRLAALMAEAGFADAKEVSLRFAPQIPAAQPFWQAQVDMGLGPRLADATADERAALDEAIQQGFARTIKDGLYHLSMHARLGLGTAPAA
ncbi:MAG: class I SAM-dependent methyltransferase [Alphaproteobacteria bacterium]|nr:class I SAM-dependent methyltransferase [Alphaproteobacteria bacterium]